MTAVVYILKHDNGLFYVGSTSDISRRIAQHMNGHTKTTKRLGNFLLAFKQEYPSLKEARKVERKLKRLKRKDYLERIIRDGYIK